MWQSTKFEKEVVFLSVLVVVTAIFDSGSTFLGVDGDLDLLLKKEANPFVRICALEAKSVVTCLIFSKVLGVFLMMGLPLFMWGALIIIHNFSKRRLPPVLGPLVTTYLIVISIVNVLAGLSWYGIETGARIYQNPVPPTATLFLVVFAIRWLFSRKYANSIVQ